SRSTDNGLTWTVVNVASTAGGPIATDKAGNWLMCQYSNANQTYKSSNNWASWTALTTAAAGALPPGCLRLECDGTNWIAGLASTATPWIARGFSAPFSRAALFNMDTNPLNGLCASNGIVAMSSGYTGTLVSLDGLTTFKSAPGLIGAVS